MFSDSHRAPLFQVTDGSQVRGTGTTDEQQRFLNEVRYVDHFGKLIGNCLGMRSMELAVVEDADSQTAFFYAPAGDGGATVNGFVSTTRRPLGQLVDSLRQEHRAG